MELASKLDMTTQSTERQARKQELIAALQTARDTIRVQAHLLSLDAKERWDELEARLSSCEAKLEREGERVAEGIASTVEKLVDATKKAVADLQGSPTSPRSPK
jgi:hypothetical protein